MKRTIYQKLLEWKKSPSRKPLILQGARQTGKTYILKEFGKTEYQDLAYFNFEEDPHLIPLFENSLDPNTLVEKLSLYQNKKISETTLIFFDEIQEAPRALTSLKYFQEKTPQYSLVTAGSLLGLKCKGPYSFPVGKVNFLNLYPMSFFEFLEAIGKSMLRDMLVEKKDILPLDVIFHEELSYQLKLYYLLGGLPEVIDTYLTSKDFSKARMVQKEILRAYTHDFSKHAPPEDSPKINQIWASLPTQLSRENKKFFFTLVKKNARGRDYQDALQWLKDAGLIYTSYCISTPQIPLEGFCEKNIFKIYLLDTGLLCAMTDLLPQVIMDGTALFTQYKGAFVENFVSQELTAHHEQPLYYWSTSGTAEVDFVFEKSGTIFPLEVKSGTQQRSRSLTEYGKRYPTAKLSMTSTSNFYHKGHVSHYPLYAVSLFPDLT